MRASRKSWTAIFIFWRRWLLVLLTLLAAIALHSCSFDRFKTPSAQISQVTIPTSSGPATFNSPLNQSYYSVFGFLYEGLLSENPVTGVLEPELAESWTVSTDKQRIIFTLREGLKWSDGEPLTADDVVFTYNDIYLNERIPADVKDILRVGISRSFPTVKKLDRRRVEFTLAEPFAPFLRFVGGLDILPEHILRAAVETDDANGNPQYLSTWGLDADPQTVVGNGPYTMESFAPGQRVVFRRNPYYWRKDEAGHSQPYIERVVWQIVESSESQLVRFRSGELDAIGTDPKAFELLKREEKRGRFSIHEGGPDAKARFVGFNLNQASRKPAGHDPLVNPIKSRWFNTLAFRQAVAYAINRETMTNNIYRGLGIQQNSPIYPASPYFFSPAAGLKVYEYNPEKAKTLLLDAGFTYNSQGALLDSDGHRVEFTLLVKAEEKTRVDMAAQIQQNLSEIGIKANLQTLNFNSILDRLAQGNWECYVGGFAGGSLEPHSGFNIWSSSGRLHQFNQGPQPGDSPLYNWQVSDWEKEIDQLFIEGARELDETKRQAIYAKFQQIVQEQLPFFYLVNQLSLDAVRDRIQGIQYSALGGAFWNIYEEQIVD